MPFNFLQKAALGKRPLKELYKQAQEIFESYVWSAANLESGQYGGDYIKLSDVKTANTAGGGFTSGAWQTRVLNTEDTDTGGNCTLSLNQFTLLAGTYQIDAFAAAFDVGRHKARLQNITDASTEIIGTSEYISQASSETTTYSKVRGEFTISASKAFEIQHRCQTTKATNGFGVESNFAVSEIYTTVELRKVK